MTPPQDPPTFPYEPTPSYSQVWAHYLAKQRVAKTEAMFLSQMHRSFTAQEFAFLSNTVDSAMLEA